MLVLYVAGQAVGCVLLAVTLWRRRAAPRWAAAVGAFPTIGLAFFPASDALAVAGFPACALTLRHAAAEPSPADTTAPLTPART